MNPFTCCNPFKRQRRPEQPVVEHHENLDTTSILPKLRPRTLTLPIPPNEAAGSRTTQTTADQSLSPYFSQLPIEIRMLIYLEVLGGKRFHMNIHPEDEKLAHIRCLVPYNGKDKSPSVKCRLSHDTQVNLCSGPIGFTGMDTFLFRSLDLPNSGYLLNLLRTCQRV